VEAIQVINCYSRGDVALCRVVGEARYGIVIEVTTAPRDVIYKVLIGLQKHSMVVDRKSIDCSLITTWDAWYSKVQV
jgi:hypothetical protein